MKKHILCFGDSNTHGYCADPSDCADGGSRFNEQERWTCLLQKNLGRQYLVLEEGLSGRTTAFEDPLNEGMSGLDFLSPILLTHEPIDLLILMLGTNDTKERLEANPYSIGLGMEQLIRKAKITDCWGNNGPEILVIAPPHIGSGMLQHSCAEDMGTGAPEKSRQLAAQYMDCCRRQDCHFLDAQGLAEFNTVDYMHLTKKGHAQLAETLARLIPTLE